MAAWRRASLHLLATGLCLSLLACTTSASDAAPPTLKSLLSPLPANPAGPRPAGSPYYAALFVNFDPNTVITDDRCARGNGWTLLEHLVGRYHAAETSLTLNVTPILNPHVPVTFPLYDMQANQNPDPGKPKCSTNILGTGVELTAFMPSTSSSGFARCPRPTASAPSSPRPATRANRWKA